jgi:hypothetical protein
VGRYAIRGGLMRRLACASNRRTYQSPHNDKTADWWWRYMDRDWMRTTQSIERVSGQRQEREFSMQRQGDKIDLFRTHSPAETAQTKKPATHVFDISAGLRVSLTHHNYRVWVVGCAVRYEPVSVLFG